jgi:hypothetical protein
MRGVTMFLFLVTIPALIALGHDLYLFYADNGMNSVAADVSQQIEDKGATSFFATLGWIWTHYSPDSYKWAVENTEPDIWAYINTALSWKAFFTGLGFAAFFFVLIGIMKVFRLGPFSERTLKGHTGSRRSDEILGKKATGQFKYKRK